MKKIFLTLILGFATLTSFAQKYSETVYLKNGSMIKGTIIEEIPNKSLKLETRDGSIFVYQMDEVEKITKELKRLNYEHFNDFDLGFKSFVDFGGVIGSQNGGRLEASASFGSQINQYLYIGGGLGVNYYTHRDAFIFPLFAEAKVYAPTNTIIHPFFSLRPGYGVSTASNYDGGFYISTLCGIEIKRYTVGLGYSLQSLDDMRFLNEGVGFNTSGFTLKIGLKF